jgi:hypothetical protein
VQGRTLGSLPWEPILLLVFDYLFATVHSVTFWEPFFPPAGFVAEEERGLRVERAPPKRSKCALTLPTSREPHPHQTPSV